MTTKRCPDCRLHKPIDEFYILKSTGKAVTYCKPCHRERRRESYRKRMARERGPTPILRRLRDAWRAFWR